ncbi:rhomboid family intramembrane serine protease [Salipiger mucosus]|uniref:Rhomboid family serine protease n=1 Tax=Salipiger mucosus DSM 16094 TaxID=1123237 RepID=S9RNW2_9RHOB|nr:rhomboid family intramembrane serine protease [Salipiger mucosus]EPX75659.1 rhomboid family serine protease [Salipiger mucosus DSM 16094]
MILLVAIEGLLVGADACLWGVPSWRQTTYQYGGFWVRLLHGWKPLYTAQPVVMFATYPFLHSDWQHVLGNGLALVWLGEQLGERIGPKRFALLLALSSLGGAVGFALLAQSLRPMVGASGIVMGLIAAWIVLEARRMSREGQARRYILRMIGIYVLGVIALNVLGTFLEAGGLAWETHLGGFIAAMVAAPLLIRFNP